MGRLTNSLCKFFDKTFLKFVMVGLINTLIGTSVMFIAYNLLHFNYWISSASNYVIGSIVSYFLNKYFTFESTDSSVKSIIRFAANISVCYFIAYGVAKPLIKIVFSGFKKVIQENLAMVLGMGLFVVLNYLGQRFFVFENKKD